MRTKLRMALGLALVPGMIAAVLVASQAPTTGSGVVKNKVINHFIDVYLGKAKQNPHMAQLSGGALFSYLDALGIIDARTQRTSGKDAVSGISVASTQGCPQVLTARGRKNIKVNQDCSFRRQAEEAIAVNPLDNQNLIAGQNDSRLGFNQCGFDWSFDGGNTWGDSNPPFHQQLLGNGHVQDFCSDPTVAFDSQGNAFFGGLGLSIDGLDAAVLVARSDAGIGGAFYHDPDQSDPWHQYKDSPIGLVNDDYDPAGCTTNDKELMAADARVGSPKQDNVYMAWTYFDFCTGQGVGAHSPIHFSQSTDGGFTWSDPIEISGSNSTFCTAFSGESDPNACDQDQGPHPVVGPDGTVYVAFGNGNTPTAGINQHMIVSCAPGSDCSQAASWTAPVKIGDDYGLQPTASATDPVTGCPGGRQCLPPNGYRMDDFVQGSLSASHNGNLFFAWADGRNLGSNCQGDYAAATAPCNNDVFYSYSTDGGATWSATTLVTPVSRFGETAQFMPWSDVNANGNHLYVSFYDRGYGSCEFSGCNDITRVDILNPATGSPSFSYTRLTTAHMPNLVVANNPVQAGFIGDYMWVTVDNTGAPLTVWADTRGRAGSVEENIYFSK